MDVFPTIKIRQPLRRLQKVRAEQVFYEYIDPVVRDMLLDIISNTQWQDVKDSYSLEHHSFYNRTYWSIKNSSELFWFEESGTRPHIIEQPPHVIPGGKLIDWMDERDIAIEWYGYIQYVLHKDPWVTHHPGTAGHHMARTARERYMPVIEKAAEFATQAVIEPIEWQEY